MKPLATKLLILYMILSTILTAQNWTELGPKTIPSECITIGKIPTHKGVGRINCIRFHPDYDGVNNKIIFAGAHQGGIWKSYDNGEDWSVLNTDNLPVLSIGDIVIDPNDPSIIYCSTGDPNRGFVANDIDLESEFAHSRGVFKSTDSGQTWTPKNNFQDPDSAVGIGSYSTSFFDFPSKSYLGEMVMNPYNSDVLFVTYYKYKPSSEETYSVVYKTVNGGNSWTKVLAADNEKLRNIEFHPTDSNIIYASGQLLYRTGNYGLTWSVIDPPFYSHSIPNTNKRRTVIATVKSDPDFLTYATNEPHYPIQNEQGIFLFNSVDGGLNFNEVNSAPFQFVNPDNPPVRFAMAIDPSDSMNLLIGSGKIRYSDDQGLSIDLSDSLTHDDIHSLEFAPTGDLAFAGTDGGVYVSSDKGVTWQFRGNGMGVAQVNNISVSKNTSSKVLIGTHDDGTILFEPHGTRFSDNDFWGHVKHGDGGKCIIDNANDSIAYASDYLDSYHDIRRTTDNYSSTDADKWKVISGLWQSAYNVFNHSNNHQNYTLDPNSSTLYIGNKIDLYYSDNYGDSFANITGSPSSLEAAGAFVSWQIGCQGRTSVDENEIKLIEIFKGNSDIIWVVLGGFPTWGDTNSCLPKPDMLLFKSYNGGVTWNKGLPNNSDPLALAMKYARITDIKINPYNPNLVCISLKGNSNSNTDYIFCTNNAGGSWVNLSNGIISGVNTLEFLETGKGEYLFAGTDFGLYYVNTDSQSGTWQSFSNGGLPNVIVSDIEFDYCRKKIIVGTKGRGVWESDYDSAFSSMHKMEINQNTVWSNEIFKTINTDLVVKSGYTLTINGVVNMATGKRIIVERGAKLIVDGGTITSYCGDHWTGIEVWGNRNADQFPVLSNTDQGLVQLNDATIENARTAISTGKYNPSIDWNYTGGIILAVNSTFRNCRRAIEYLSYRNTHPSSGAYIGNAGRIVSCSLLLDNGFYNPGNQDVSLVTLYDVDGVRFIGNTFLNQSDHDMKHNAIYADNAGFSVENKFNISSTEPNQFSNFQYAIKSHGFNSYKFVKIDGCNFNGNFRSVYVSGQLFPRITNNSINIPQLSGEYEGDGAYGIYIHDSRGYRVEGNDIIGQFDPQGTGPSFVKTEIGTYTTSSGSFGNMIYKNSIDGAKVSNAARYDNSGLRYFCNEMSNYRYAIASYETGIHVFQGNCGTEGGEDAANTFDNDGDKELKSQSNFEYFYRNSSPYIPATHDNPVTITACSEGEERDCPLLLESLPFDPGGDYEQSKTEANGFVLGLEEASGEEEEAYLFSEFFNQYSLASMYALSITDTIDSLEFYTPAYTSLLTWYDSIKDALDTIIPAHIALAQLISDPSDVRNLLNEYDSTYGGFTKEIRLIEIHHYLDSAGLDTLDTYAETELTDIADEYNGDTIVDDESGYIGAKNMLRYFKSQSYEEPVVPLPGEQSARLKKPESDSTETEGITFRCRPNPFGGIVNINIVMESALPGAEISIVSMLGEQIYLRKLGDEKEMEFRVDLTGFADGTYICTFRNGDRILKTVKLSKVRR